MAAIPAGKPILLIDDDAELGNLLEDYLGREGFRLEVAGDGTEGLARARSGAYSLVLLDIMLPGLDGFEVIKELRRGSYVPVIMLTARGDEVDRIVGLELGADDYLPKPFNPRELTARIKAVLRRAERKPEASDTPPYEAQGSKMLRFAELSIDLEAYQARLGESELPLTAIEFALLRELALAAGRVLSRDTLLDRVRGREFDLFDRSIDVHISHLRQKLGDDPRAPRFIRTVRSVGYMFIRGSD